VGIEFSNLTFSYGAQPVLQGVTMSADYGELVALLGPNGAGKSTMMRCLLGFLRDYGGEIKIDGQEIRKLSRPALAKKVAYIPQAAPVVFNYTVLDTVLMGATGSLGLLSSPGAELKDKALELLKSLGAEHLANRGTGELSGGERQLVLLARALIQDAKILVMDEPTANLDYGNQNRVMQQVTSLARRGYLVLYSTHDPNQTLLYATRAITLSGGKLLSDGDPKSTLTESVLETLYNIPVTRQTISVPSGDVEICLPRK
jgi:iron complex transport system ATP-binding protein